MKTSCLLGPENHVRPCGDQKHFYLLVDHSVCVIICDLQLPNITPRGVQLASLFMAGVETAQAANDVCGAPIPARMCCPWLFFDGKLFHFKLLKANNNTPLIDMCDGQVTGVSFSQCVCVVLFL
jgi:hypothetical protein